MCNFRNRNHIFVLREMRKLSKHFKKIFQITQPKPKICVMIENGKGDDNVEGLYSENPLFLDSVKVYKGGAAMTESEIIARLKQGSSDALCALIGQYTAYVSGIIFRIIGYHRKEDCEELTADVFIIIWNNRHKLRENKVKAYIGEITRNKAYNFLRSKRETLPLDEEILFNGENPQEYAEKRDGSLKLRQALSQLEPRKKELMLRYYFYGQKLKDAAEDMNIKGSTAKSMLKRGREELREILGKEDYSYEG